MTINTEPYALYDLLGHVISGRANVGEIEALIEYLQGEKERVKNVGQSGVTGSGGLRPKGSKKQTQEIKR